MTCGVKRHPFCTMVTGWLGAEGSSGAPAETYTTTFSRAPPDPATNSSRRGGVLYILAQSGSAAMLIGLAAGIVPSTVTLPEMLPPPSRGFAPRAAKATVRHRPARRNLNDLL